MFHRNKKIILCKPENLRKSGSFPLTAGLRCDMINLLSGPFWAALFVYMVCSTGKQIGIWRCRFFGAAAPLALPKGEPRALPRQYDNLQFAAMLRQTDMHIFLYSMGMFFSSFSRTWRKYSGRGANTITGRPSLGWRKQRAPAWRHWLSCPSSGFL